MNNKFFWLKAYETTELNELLEEIFREFVRRKLLAPKIKERK